MAENTNGGATSAATTDPKAGEAKGTTDEAKTNGSATSTQPLNSGVTTSTTDAEAKEQAEEAPAEGEGGQREITVFGSAGQTPEEKAALVESLQKERDEKAKEETGEDTGLLKPRYRSADYDDVTVGWTAQQPALVGVEAEPGQYVLPEELPTLSGMLDGGVTDPAFFLAQVPVAVVDDKDEPAPQA